MLTISLALLVVVAADGAPDPCRAARAPLPAAAGVSAADRAAFDDYRAAWRRVCDPAGGAADLGSLLGDAEALVEDVRTSRAVETLSRAHAAGSSAAWPLPAILAGGDAPLAVDWSAFAAMAERGTAEDARFWRGAARVVGRTGEPAWLGEAPPGSSSRCVRLGEVGWSEIADALDAMERAGSTAYVRHARELRGALAATFADIARGPSVCACLRGDATAGLAPLAASSAAERVGTPARRALARSAADALDALRTGRARVAFLREGPGAPPTGCRPR